MAGTDRPCVVLSPSGFLVWDPRHIYVLRCSHRLVGALLGPPPSRQAYRQAADNGAPLSLSFEETLLAAEEGIADVVDGSSGTYGAIRDVRPEPVPLQALRLNRTDRELQRAHVFRQLWARGHFVTSGAAFGADYLCYPGDPIQHHAHLLVHVTCTARPLRPLELVAAARLAASVKKTAALAEVVDGSRVRFLTLTTTATNHVAVSGKSRQHIDAWVTPQGTGSGTNSETDAMRAVELAEPEASAPRGGEDADAAQQGLVVPPAYRKRPRG